MVILRVVLPGESVRTHFKFTETLFKTVSKLGWLCGKVVRTRKHQQHTINVISLPWLSIFLYYSICIMCSMFVCGHIHKYHLDFSPIMNIWYECSKVSVTLMKWIYDNCGHSKTLHRRMVFNWQKIAFYLGKIQEKHYHLSKKQKKDRKITSKTWKRIKNYYRTLKFVPLKLSSKYVLLCLEH